jgi:hypothetical protein
MTAWDQIRVSYFLLNALSQNYWQMNLVLGKKKLNMYIFKIMLLLPNNKSYFENTIFL